MLHLWEHKLFLVRYVDDFKMSGPPDKVAIGFKLIAEGIDLDPVEDANHFIGVTHTPGFVNVKGTQDHPDNWSRCCILDCEAYLEDSVKLYRELMIGMTGKEPKLSDVDTPSIPSIHRRY